MPTRSSATWRAARRYQAALFDAGLAGLTWPKPWGPGLTSEHTRVFNEEAAGHALPTAIYTIGLGMVIPTLIEFGTDEQKERYVAKALRGEEVWSQLFSEPGAGSDVASLQMRAELDGEEWVLNGQKVWTTGAQLSDYGAVIARTNVDVPKHQGITMFIIDFHAPGRRGAATPADDRWRQLQRGVLQRRAHPRRPGHRPGRRRLALRRSRC